MKPGSLLFRVTLIAATARCAVASTDRSSGDLRPAQILAEARDAADRISDPAVKARTLDLIAIAQARLGDIAGAQQTADSITSDASASDGLANTQAGWRKDARAGIAAARAACGDLAGAEAGIKAISDPDTKDEACLYCAQSLAEKGDIENAAKFAAQTGGIDRTRADAAIAIALAGRGNVAPALNTAAALGDPYEQVQALCKIAECQAKSRDLHGANQTLALARSAASHVPGWLARDTYCALVRAYVQAGDMNSANEFRKIDAPYILEAIATAQADKGDVSGARAMIEAIADPCSLARADAALALAEFRANDPSAADDALDAARYSFTSITDPSDGADVAARITAAQGMLGDPSAAADWAHAQQDPAVEANALLSLAGALNQTRTVGNAPLAKVSD